MREKDKYIYQKRYYYKHKEEIYKKLKDKLKNNKEFREKRNIKGRELRRMKSKELINLRSVLTELEEYLIKITKNGANIEKITCSNILVYLKELKEKYK